MAHGITTTGAALDVPEEKLIQAARDGDVEAFGVLFERYKDAIYGFLLRSVRRREDAEDMVQETFCRAWRSISGFRGSAKLTTWLCRIAVNVCAEHRRSAKSRTLTATDLGMDTEQLTGLAGGAAQPDTDTDTSHTIDQALAALPLSHRMLVDLCDIQGYNCREAAGIVGCSAVSARVRLGRARKKLRSLLEQTLNEVEI